MRLSLLTFALLTTSLSTAFAGDLVAVSKIDAVTVFPQGAEVTRMANAHLPAGDTTLLLQGLPQEVDPQSIRVEGAGGQGIEISSVDTRAEPVFASEADRKQMEDQIQALTDERSALDQTLTDADYQKRLLMALADKQLTPVAQPDKPATIDGAGLGSVLDVVAAKLETISKTIHSAQLRQRDIDKSVAELQTKLANLAPDQGSKLNVAIHLSAAAETDGAFKVRYRVASAQWSPFYDARLATAETGKTGKIEIVRRAEVVQNTGEEWKDVALTLSTARTLGATEAPLLSEDELQVYNPAEELKRKELGMAGGSAQDAPAAAPATENGMLMTEKMSADAAKPALQRQALVTISGFQAQYEVQGRETVDNSGTSKKVRITTDNYDGELKAFTVPKLDTQAYLTASFKVASDAPILPGPVNIYRDGIYLGQGGLPQLNAGDEVKLGFGADDLIKVKRTEVKRQTGEEGIISSSNVRVQAWDISVKNLHKFAMPVQVLDQMPFSANENVTVELLPTNTEPSVKDYEKRRGVYAWNFDLDAQAEKQLNFGYKILWPKDVNVSLTE